MLLKKALRFVYFLLRSVVEGRVKWDEEQGRKFRFSSYEKKEVSSNDKFNFNFTLKYVSYSHSTIQF